MPGKGRAPMIVYSTPLQGYLGTKNELGDNMFCMGKLMLFDLSSQTDF